MASVHPLLGREATPSENFAELKELAVHIFDRPGILVTCGRILMLLMSFNLGAVAAASPRLPIRLYAMDCGEMRFTDLGLFSDTGFYDHQSGSIVDPCFLIRHPDGLLLWDAGLGDALVGHDVPANAAGISIHVQSRLLDQLRAIGVNPSDVKFLAFSHFHLDHTGNANAFAGATWIINERELKWALEASSSPIVALDTFSGYRRAATRMISGDYDVFGDGTVRILSTPGHTPGHQVLLVQLPSAGAVLLSGDLYHMESDRPLPGARAAQVMVNNVNRADTLASMDRVEEIVRNLHARIVVQHDRKDFLALPAFPAYLE